MFEDFKSTLVEGDQIETEVNWNKNKRVATFEKGGVRIKGYWFSWNFFFEVNTPVKKVEHVQQPERENATT